MSTRVTKPRRFPFGYPPGSIRASFDGQFLCWIGFLASLLGHAFVTRPMIDYLGDLREDFRWWPLIAVTIEAPFALLLSLASVVAAAFALCELFFLLRGRPGVQVGVLRKHLRGYDPMGEAHEDSQHRCGLQVARHWGRLHALARDNGLKPLDDFWCVATSEGEWFPPRRIAEAIGDLVAAIEGRRGADVVFDPALVPDMRRMAEWMLVLERRGIVVQLTVTT